MRVKLQLQHENLHAPQCANVIPNAQTKSFLHKPYGPYVKAYFKSPEFFRNEVGGVPQGETSCVDWCFMPGGEVPKPGGDVFGLGARENVLFLSFPYICPEPVLANDRCS